MKKPASTWPTAVPTSVTRLTMPLSPDCSLIASWMLLRYWSICESLAFSGPSRSQSLISWMPSTVESARSEAPLATCCPAKLSSATTEAMVNSTTRIDAMLRRTPTRSSQSTTGTTSAEMSSATTTGMTMTARNEIR